MIVEDVWALARAPIRLAFLRNAFSSVDPSRVEYIFSVTLSRRRYSWWRQCYFTTKLTKRPGTAIFLTIVLSPKNDWTRSSANAISII